MKQTKRRAPKKLQAVQTSRHLRVSQHKHTGHVLPRRSTSYPVLVMIVLCVGVFLAGWTRVVTADSPLTPPESDQYSVTASVPGVPPAQPATIETPTPDTHTRTTPQTVQGSCSQETYVEILRNGFSSGVALCSALGTYELKIDLFPGLNQLVARVHNLADTPGQDSGAVNVYYTVASAPAGYVDKTVYSGTPGQASSSQASPATQALPLLVRTNFHFQGYYTGQSAHLPFSIEGGVAPYAVGIDWGDDTRDLFSRPSAGAFDPVHVYKKHGAYRGSYVITATVTDSVGESTYLQTMTVINDVPVAKTTKTPESTGGVIQGISVLQSGDLGRLVKYVWPSYGVVVLMLTSFWLGERRELRYLKPHRRKVHHA